MSELTCPDSGTRSGSASCLRGFWKWRAVCLTNDSGPRHLAVAVGAPSIAIFRRHHGMEWAVYQETERCVTLTGRADCDACPPDTCRDLIPPGEQFGSVCLRQIGVDEVFASGEGDARRYFVLNSSYVDWWYGSIRASVT